MQKAFILGNPRSGTSLLRIMLNAHPQIASPPECGFLQWWFEKYRVWSLKNSESRDDITKYVDDLLDSRKIEAWKIDKENLVDFIAGKKPISYSDLGLSVYEYWAHGEGKSPSLIVDKNNYYIHHLSDLNQIWPDARYVYIIRDGRDVASSYLEVGKLDTVSPYKPVLSDSIEEIAREWVANNTTIKDFLNGQERRSYFVLKYEDLILKTEDVLRAIMSFFDLPFSDKMMKYYLYNDEPGITLDWKKKTLEAPDPANIGKFKNKLSKHDRELFEMVAASLLKEYKYI